MQRTTISIAGFGLDDCTGFQPGLEFGLFPAAATVLVGRTIVVCGLPAACGLAAVETGLPPFRRLDRLKTVLKKSENRLLTRAAQKRGADAK